MALRTALGASRGRLLRQLVTESLLLSLAGGAAGLAVALVGMGLLDRLFANIRSLPGVKSAGASGVLPFSDNAGLSFNRFTIEGRPIADRRDWPRASVVVANGDYFRAIDIPLIKDRLFSDEDGLDAPEVAIVNRSLAERHWPGQDAIGRRISPGDGAHWVTIIGVIANVRQQLATDPVDELYIPLSQLPYVTTTWAIRATTEPQVLEPLLREAVRRADPDQPVHRVRTLDDIRQASLTPPRLTTILLGLFAGLALVITATGIAGVIAFSVSQRTQEFGVRMALGARRIDVVTMILREGLRLAVAGLTLGIVGAVLLGGLLSTMLFRVAPTDGVTYLAVSSVLLGVAAIACLLPAMRAAAVNPMQALGHVEHFRFDDLGIGD